MAIHYSTKFMSDHGSSTVRSFAETAYSISEEELRRRVREKRKAMLQHEVEKRKGKSKVEEYARMYGASNGFVGSENIDKREVRNHLIGLKASQVQFIAYSALGIELGHDQARAFTHTMSNTQAHYLSKYFRSNKFRRDLTTIKRLCKISKQQEDSPGRCQDIWRDV